MEIAATASAAPSLLPLLLLVAALATAPAHAEDRPLPEYLHVCKKSDPALVDCVKAAIEDLRPRLATGMPELNVPALEPLELRQLKLNRNPNLQVLANDIKAYRTTTFQINQLNIDLDAGKLTLEVSFPVLNIEGTYEVDGRILLLPVKGTGPLFLNITNVDASVALQMSPQEVDGEEYLGLQELKVEVKVGGGSIRVENLFNGDKILGEVVNSAVNANFAHTLQELKPSVESALEEALLGIGQKIFLSYPRRQLLPDD